MKILLLLPNLEGGGAERVNIELARQFVKYGIDVEIVLKQAYGILLSEAKSEFSIINLNSKSLIKTIFTLAKYIDKCKPDALIVSMWGLTAYASFSKLITKHKYKLLLVEHSSLVNQFKDSRLIIKLWLRVSIFFAYRIADFLAGVSYGVSRDMQYLAKLNKLPETLYNPIPVMGSIKKFQERQNHISKTTYTIVTAGRLIKAKDYSTLIESFAIVNNKIDAKLIILGKGPLLNELREQARNLNILDKVFFKGFVNDPHKYFQKADLFVLSSMREGLSTVLIEAMGCGTPVVATNCNHGPSEILDNGKYGRLVPVGNVELLADAIFKTLKEKNNPDKLIRRAFDFAPENSAKHYLQVLDLYNSIKK